MARAMDPLPTRADDPRLEGWYQTIELGPGLVTRNAEYDLRPIVDRVGFPGSLAGWSALDVGTADGFWAFELERRGADRVVAFDIARLSESDVIPRRRAQLSPRWFDAENYCAERFWTAHALRGSKVEYHTGNVYQLSPETVGTFDLVYCGSLLIHLFNPLQAVINIRSVTRRMAIIEAYSFDPEQHPIERSFPDEPIATFGALATDQGLPGRQCCYWRFTTKALCDLMIYSGFATVEPRGIYELSGPAGNRLAVTTVAGYVDERPEGQDRSGQWPTAVLCSPSTDVTELRAGLEQARAELAAARAEKVALEAQLEGVRGLGPRSIRLARFVNRAAQRFRRLSRIVRSQAAG